MLIIGALAVVLVGLVGFLIFHQMSGGNGSDVSHVKLDTSAPADTRRGTEVPMGSANGGGSAAGNSGVHTPHKSSDSAPR